MPTPVRFPPEWPEADPYLADRIPPIKPKDALRHLQRALDDFYFASVESELDRQSHGSRIKKSRATMANHCRLLSDAADLIEALRGARRSVMRMPSPEADRALVKLEQQALATIERFENLPDPSIYH